MIRRLTYTAIIAISILSGLALKHSGISVLGCPATGYDDEWFLAHCRTNTYGDYEEGALYYGFEPKTLAALRQADVVFLGDSRVEYAFSFSATAADWFAARRLRYYLMGLAGQGVEAAERILLRHDIAPPLVVVDATQFFRPDAPWATSERLYAVKHFWQGVHRSVCSVVPAACSLYQAIYRSRKTGAWRVYPLPQARIPVHPKNAGPLPIGPVEARARVFLQRLGTPAGCVIFTAIPNNEQYDSEETTVLAARLGVTAIIPRLEGLNTIDDWHLDGESATRWTSAFLQALAPNAEACRRPARP